MKNLVAVLICSLTLTASAEATGRHVSVAVVQFESTNGDIAGNLNNAKRWLDRAVAAVRN